LLDTFSVKDNILLPLVLGGVPISEMEQRLLPVATELGIADLQSKYPYEISGGQKQRVLFQSNQPLFIGCTIASLAVFAIIYVLIYRIKARIYYQIVVGQG
jgi:hypothetical protein